MSHRQTRSSIPVKCDKGSDKQPERVPEKDAESGTSKIPVVRLTRSTRSSSQTSKTSESESDCARRDSNTSPGKIDDTNVRRRTRASSIQSQSVEEPSIQLKTPRLTRASSRGIDRSGSPPPPPNTPAQPTSNARVTRSATVSESDQSSDIKKTPARVKRPVVDDLDVINEEADIPELLNFKIIVPQISSDALNKTPLRTSSRGKANTPSRTRAETALIDLTSPEDVAQTEKPTPTRVIRTRNAGRPANPREGSASPSRITRAMRKEGFVTPTADNDVICIDDDESKTGLQNSSGVATPARLICEKISKNLLNLIYTPATSSTQLGAENNDTPKPVPVLKITGTPLESVSDSPATGITPVSTSEVKTTTCTPITGSRTLPKQSLLTPALAHSDDSFMDWESLPTPATSKNATPIAKVPQILSPKIADGGKTRTSVTHEALPHVTAQISGVINSPKKVVPVAVHTLDENVVVKVEPSASVFNDLSNVADVKPFASELINSIDNNPCQPPAPCPTLHIEVDKAHFKVDVPILEAADHFDDSTGVPVLTVACAAEKEVHVQSNVPVPVGYDSFEDEPMPSPVQSAKTTTSVCVVDSGKSIVAKEYDSFDEEDTVLVDTINAYDSFDDEDTTVINAPVLNSTAAATVPLETLSAEEEWDSTLLSPHTSSVEEMGKHIEAHHDATKEHSSEVSHFHIFLVTDASEKSTIEKNAVEIIPSDERPSEVSRSENALEMDAAAQAVVTEDSTIKKRADEDVPSDEQHSVVSTIDNSRELNIADQAEEHIIEAKSVDVQDYAAALNRTSDERSSEDSELCSEVSPTETLIEVDIAASSEQNTLESNSDVAEEHNTKENYETSTTVSGPTVSTSHQYVENIKSSTQPCSDSASLDGGASKKKKNKNTKKTPLASTDCAQNMGYQCNTKPVEKSVLVVVQADTPTELASATLAGDKKDRKVPRKKIRSIKSSEDVADDETKDVNEEEVGSDKYPDLRNFKHFFKNTTKSSSKIVTSLGILYKWVHSVETRADDLPDRFISPDNETVWQQLAHRNRQISKEYKKNKDLLDAAVVLPGIEASDDSEDDVLSEDEEADDFGVEDEDMELMQGAEDEEDECDLFNLDDEDLKDLEKQLEDEEGENDDAENLDGEVAKPQKKYPKSSVDDKFFNLAEMDAFLDEQEQKNEDDGILATVDDSSVGGTNYRYEDFFGKCDDAATSVSKKPKKTKKRKATDDDDLNSKKKKSVRFAMDDDTKDLDADIVDEVEVFEAPVLMGDGILQEEEQNPSNLKKSLKKLKETIAKLEAENLQPRSWELSGEVAAHQRDQNTLLEKHVQFDHGAKNAPEITEDFTEKLEALIKQRIKDRVFDDVVRKVKSNERVEKYRNEAIEDSENVKKSLTEVYEKEYQKAAGQVDTVEKPNEEHLVIERKMKELFRMIDSLSHFEYTPPEVRPEVRVVSNMAALRVEEVGMMASTDAQLLAPEEMKKRQKGDLKGDEERDATDKLRQRRKKKLRQRAMVMVLGEEKAFANNPKKLEKIKKKKRTDDKPADKLKSSSFFNKLQDTVNQELKEKTTKKKKRVKSEKVVNGGSKFKL